MFYDKKVLLSNEKFLEAARKMYACSPEQSAARLADLAARHAERFGIEGARVFSSPGRIEVCGNHTDHNNGKVTAAAVSVDTLAVVTPLTERKVKICSLGYPYVEVDVDDLKIDPNEEGTSAALIRGVLKGMQERGYAVGGFAATMTSNVCKGAGMSSSASYEVLIAEIVNVLYNGGKAGEVGFFKDVMHNIAHDLVDVLIVIIQPLAGNARADGKFAHQPFGDAAFQDEPFCLRQDLLFSRSALLFQFVHAYSVLHFPRKDKQFRKNNLQSVKFFRKNH